MIQARFKNQLYEGEVRNHGSEGYLVVIRGGMIQDSFTVPKILRSGQSGLDMILEEVEFRIERKGK